ncbi:MAG TPA: polysaccharide biosynthesis C-terminal domain-containing protein [Candidatus Limnocylindrales bacterium]|nr:polysaccharide biosynthesis C-terminal domain-containing protein [Candidatus Limnocylindrales bacterium]
MTARTAPSPLLRDALFTIGTRFGLAILIFTTDILLARLLGPAAKGRFALVLLYSQLAALIVGFGMDSALGLVAGRGPDAARRGFANALLWTAVAGGFAVVLSGWLYGLPTEVRPRGPLAMVIPNLSAAQFAYAALAIPGELFFSLGLYALLGRKRVVAYGSIRLLRRALLVVFVVAAAAIARLSLDVALLLNLGVLVATGVAILWAAGRDGMLGARPSAPLLQEEFRFGGRAILGTLAERLQFRADAFLVNALRGVRETGVYSVTSGLAETLWYIPNALGTVMFSRAVDPAADAGRIAAVLTRTTIAVAIATSIPAFILGPRLVEIVYGAEFGEAGDALRLILPGVVAYSVVAVLSRYIVGQGRPGTGTAVLLSGLILNVASNLVLIPRFGILGAAASSSISYAVTALLTLFVFRRLSGRSWTETLILRDADMRAVGRAASALGERLRGRRRGPLVGLRGGGAAAEIVIGEREPGEEL